MFYVEGNNSQMYFDVKEYKPHPFPNAISGSVFDILPLVGPSAIVQNLTLRRLYRQICVLSDAKLQFDKKYRFFFNLPILQINQIG